MRPYYQDELVTLYHARCEDVLPNIVGVDLIFTSPPYNLGTTTGGGLPARLGHYRDIDGLGSRGGSRRLGKWGGGELAHGYGEHDDAMPHDDYVAWQWSVVRSMWECLSDTGAIFYNHKPRVLGGRVVLPLTYIPDDLPIRQVLIWARAGGTNFSPTFYVPTHEWIVIIAKPDWRLRDKAASGVGDVWYVPQESGTKHPAPFPVGLPARAIETTAVGDRSYGGLVLDPFAGGGSTLIAAKAAGRPSIGIEREERWCELAASRLSQEVLGLLA